MPLDRDPLAAAVVKPSMRWRYDDGRIHLDQRDGGLIFLPHFATCPWVRKTRPTDAIEARRWEENRIRRAKSLGELTAPTRRRPRRASH
jgi:hypothetical protein